MPRKLRPRSVEKRKNRSIPTEREANIARFSSGNIFEELEELLEEEERQLEEEEAARIQREQEEAAQIISSVPDFRHDLYFETNTSPKKKCFRVTFREHPEYFCYVFADNRNKAESLGQKQIRERYYPLYKSSECPVTLREAKGTRAPEFDEYKGEGRIPVLALMKADIKFSCSCCGKFKFDYEDVIMKKCFIIEGEGDINAYTKGMVVCYECYKKFYCI